MKFCDGNSEIQHPGSGQKKIVDAKNQRRTAQIAASHPLRSSQQIVSDCAKRVQMDYEMDFSSKKLFNYRAL